MLIKVIAKHKPKHVKSKQGSISQTFYKQLSRVQIPKSAKKLLNLNVFSALLGSARVKAARRMLLKLTPGGKIITNLLCGTSCKEKTLPYLLSFADSTSLICDRARNPAKM